MEQFIAGQRWISDNELQMGLGTVLAVEHRTVTLVFLATGETRTYARHNAPLTRVQFAPGDSVRSHEGWELTITGVKVESGLFVYQGHNGSGQVVNLPEGQLDNFIQLNKPTDRLFSRQIDHNKWFDLRYRTHVLVNRVAHSDLRGLTGGRVSLIPHQLYIAHEVARRYAPRVLLADEVGLGKTIEAGMILHQQLLMEKVQRVLIIVPETLLHQWLVEMLRRFNLRFSLFDEERCLAIEESGDSDNPFQHEQLVLCSLNFLMLNPQRWEQTLHGHWDLLIVDEAHHLQWSPQQPSLEYRLVSALAARTKGVVLLTATPEQLGKSGHFARLRLLDPDRFHDLDAFIAEEQSYQKIAGLVETLLAAAPLDAKARKQLQNTLPDHDLAPLFAADADPEQVEELRLRVVDHLLDRHGTGRVLFRNTRHAVHGFPPRQLLSYPLTQPAAYVQAAAELQSAGITDSHLLMCPERLYEARADEGQPSWLKLDPRMEWLQQLLKQIRPAKALIIAASAQTAMAIQETLRARTGIHGALFHEGMSIVERDRAAAYFADAEYGTQVLICSEIGSEGRNFQFAHHLIMFDLPMHPDLLEQRIGRLDRIGQQHTISIHVPYLQNSAQEIMFRWYNEGLNAFAHTCPAGASVYAQMKDTLMAALHQVDDGMEDLQSLLATTRKLHQELNLALEQGRDRLLEINSCRPATAQRLQARAAANDDNPELEHFLEAVCDAYGIDMEDDTPGSYLLRPSDTMQMQGFPGLDPEGMAITFSRATALANEDVHFMSWEHPLITGAMELLASGERGNTAVIAVKTAGLPPGSLLLECIFVLEPASGSLSYNKQYTPPVTLRLVVDKQGNDHAQALSPETLSRNGKGVTSDVAQKIVRSQQEEIRRLVATAQQLATALSPQILAAAYSGVQDTLREEINRLQALRRVNPNVRQEEIDYFTTQLHNIQQLLAHTRMRLDALRVIATL